MWQTEPPTFKFSLDSGMAGLGASKSALGTINFLSSIRAAFITDITPLAFSKWPMLDLIDPMCNGSPGDKCLLTAWYMAAASMGSPTLVPVPWASKKAMSCGLIPDCFRTSRISLSCSSELGATMPTFGRATRQYAPRYHLCPVMTPKVA